MGITDSALNIRIQPTKGPDLDAEIKNLFTILAAGNRAANRGGGGGRGGSGAGGMGKVNWVFDEESGQFVPVPGGTEKLATSNFAAMKRWQAKQALNSEAGEGVRKKLAEFDNASVEKQADLLAQMRKEDIPALAKATNVNPALLIEQTLGEATAAHKKRKKEVEDQGYVGVAADSGKIGFNRFLDNIADLFSNGEEQIARAKRREEYEKEVREQNPFLRNLERRRQEGAGALDTLSLKSALAQGAEMVGTMGGPLALVGGVGGIAARGATALGAGLKGVNAARMAGMAGAGALTGAGYQTTATAERLNADQNLTEEQKVKLADELRVPSAVLGGAIGAVVTPFAEPAMRGVGRAVANRGIGNSLTAQAVRRANERGFSREVAEPFINVARAADDEAAIAALNKGGLGGFMSGWAKGVPIAAAETTALMVPQQMIANVQYEKATGRPVDITEGVGDVVAGALMGAPLLGVFTRPRGPKPPAVSARDQLLNAAGVRAKTGIGLPEGGVNNGAIVPRAYDPDQVINPGGLGAGTATGEVVDTTFRNAPEALPGQTPALTTGESARATEHGPIEQPAGTTTALPTGRPGRTTTTYEHGPIPRPAGTSPRAIPSTTSDEARAAGDVLYGHGWEARPVTLSGKFSNWQSVGGVTEDLKKQATKFVAFPGKKTVAKGIEEFNAWKQTASPEEVDAMRRLLASQRQADNYESTFSQKQKDFIDQVLKQEESARPAPTAPRTDTEQATTTTTRPESEPAPTTRTEQAPTSEPEPAPTTRPEQTTTAEPEPKPEPAPEPAPRPTQPPRDTAAVAREQIGLLKQTGLDSSHLESALAKYENSAKTDADRRELEDAMPASSTVTREDLEEVSRIASKQVSDLVSSGMDEAQARDNVGMMVRQALNTEKAFGIPAAEALNRKRFENGYQKAEAAADTMNTKSGPDVDDSVAGGPHLYQTHNLPDWEVAMRKHMRVDGATPEEIEQRVAESRFLSEFAAWIIERNYSVPHTLDENLTPTTGNSDKRYGISVDFSTICTKREAMGATVNAIVDALGRPLNEVEMRLVRGLYISAGEATPCSYCYLEPNRIAAMMDVADRLVDLYKASLDPNYKPDLSAASLRHFQKAVKEIRAKGIDMRTFNFQLLTNELLATEFNRKRLEEVGGDVNKLTGLRKWKDTEAPNTYRFLEFRFKSHKAKAVVPYAEYKGQLFELARKDPSFVATRNRNAGLRIFSNSDFRIEHYCDMSQVIFDCQTLGLKGHLYTKVPEFVDIYQNTGLKMNLSLFARRVNKNGYTDPRKWTFEVDPSQSQDLDFVLLKSRFFEHIGGMMMSIDENVIAAAMVHPGIFMIIPYHSSGATIDLMRAMEYQNFSSNAHEEPLEYRSAPGDKKGRAVEREAAQVNPGELGIDGGVTDTEGTIRYLLTCKDKKALPRFCRFLFNDWKPIEGTTEKAQTQRAAAAKASKDRWREIFTGDSEVKLTREWLEADAAKGDNSVFNYNFFKLIKDYARTDTPFVVPDASKIDQPTAMKYFEEYMNAGGEAKYLPNQAILNDALDIIKGGHLKATRADIARAEAMGWDLHTLLMTGKKIPGDYPILTKKGGSIYQNPITQEYRWVQDGAEPPLGFSRYDGPRRGSTTSGGITLNQSAARGDAAYMDAVNRNDMETVQRMVNEAAEKAGLVDPLPAESGSWKLRTGPAPKKTITVYKLFNVDPKTGRVYPLFVSNREPVPVGVWLDAKDTYAFQDAKGNWYTPSTSSKTGAKSGATGKSVPIPNERVRQELIKRGFLSPNSKRGTIEGVAYRPGWHAGKHPYFPRVGTKTGAHNYELAHRYDQVIFKCEMAADTNYTDIARGQEKAQKKHGGVDYRKADLQYMPKDGYYQYATNARENPKTEDWFISNSLKIVRAMSQAECDSILKKNGKLPQEWEQGTLNLSDLKITGKENDAPRKTLAPITYDENGNIIPLSKRFDPDNPSVLYQNNQSDLRGQIRIGEGAEQDIITIFKNGDASTLPHETAHSYTAQMDRTIEDNGNAALRAMREQLPESINASDGVSLADVRRQVEAMPEGAEKAKALRAVEQCEYRMQKLEQLKADRRTLRRFADMPEEGQLSNEQYREYQEQVARAFEQYVATGRAPTPELTGVFQRFFQWLKGIYDSWRAYVGKDVPEEVYGVFDRWFDANSKRGLGGEGNAPRTDTEAGLSGMGRSDAGGAAEAPVRNTAGDSGRPEGVSTDAPVGGAETPVQTAGGRENAEAGGNAGAGPHPATTADETASAPAAEGTRPEDTNGEPGAGRPAGGREEPGTGAGGDESPAGVRAGSDSDTRTVGEPDVAQLEAEVGARKAELDAFIREHNLQRKKGTGIYDVPKGLQPEFNRLNRAYKEAVSRWKPVYVASRKGENPFTPKPRPGETTEPQAETPVASAPTADNTGATHVNSLANQVREEADKRAPQLRAEADQLQAEAEQAKATMEAFCREHNIQRNPRSGSYEVSKDMPEDVQAQFHEVTRVYEKASYRASQAVDRIKANSDIAETIEKVSDSLLSGKYILARNQLAMALHRARENNIPNGAELSRLSDIIDAAQRAEELDKKALAAAKNTWDSHSNGHNEAAQLLAEADDIRAQYGLERSPAGKDVAERIDFDPGKVNALRRDQLQSRMFKAERDLAKFDGIFKITPQQQRGEEPITNPKVAAEREKLLAELREAEAAYYAVAPKEGAQPASTPKDATAAPVDGLREPAPAGQHPVPNYTEPNPLDNPTIKKRYDDLMDFEVKHGLSSNPSNSELNTKLTPEQAKAYEKLRRAYENAVRGYYINHLPMPENMDTEARRVFTERFLSPKAKEKWSSFFSNRNPDIEMQGRYDVPEFFQYINIETRSPRTLLRFYQSLRDVIALHRAKYSRLYNRYQLSLLEHYERVYAERASKAYRQAIAEQLAVPPLVPGADRMVVGLSGSPKEGFSVELTYLGENSPAVTIPVKQLPPYLASWAEDLCRGKYKGYQASTRRQEFEQALLDFMETPVTAILARPKSERDPLLRANVKKYLLDGETIPTGTNWENPLPYTPEIHKQMQDFKAANPRAGIKKLTGFYRSLLDPKAPDEAAGMTLNQTANPDLGAQLITADREAGFGTTESMASDRSPVMESMRQEDAQARQDAETAKTVSELSDLLDGGMYLGQSATKGVQNGCQKTANQVLRDIQKTGREGMKQRLEDVKRIQDYVAGTQMGTSNWFINLKNWFFQNFTSDRGLMHLWLHTFARDGRAMDNRVIQAFEGMQAVVQSKNVEYQNRMKAFLSQLVPTAVRTGMSVNDVAELVGHYHVAHDVANTNALLIERWQASADTELALAKRHAGTDAEKAHLAEAEKHLRNIEKLRIQNGELPDNGRYDWSKEPILSCGYTNPEAEDLMARVSRKLGLTRDELNRYAEQLTAEFNFLLRDRAAAGVITPGVLDSFPDRPTYAPMVSRRTVNGNPGNLSGCMSDANPYNPGKYYAIDGRYSRPDSSFISYQSYAKRAAIEIGSRDFGVALNAVYERLARQGNGALEASGIRRMNYDQMIAMRGNGMADVMDALYARGGMVVSIPNAKGEMTRYFFNFKAGGWDAQGARFFGDTLSKSISSAFKMVDVAAPVDLAARMSTGMGMLSTRFTPLFAPVAALRDFAERTLNIVNRTYYREDGTAISGAAAAKQFFLNAGTASNIARQATLTRNLDPNSDAGRLWQEFESLGGVQRFTDRGYQKQVNDMVKVQRSADDLLNGPNGQNVVLDKLGLTSKPARQVFALGSGASKRALSALDRWNDAWQNSAAFTHFYTLRKMGVSAVDAAAGAREMMNLSQRGKLGPFFQMLAPFVVPTVQAGTAMLRTLGFGANNIKDVPKEGLKGYLALLGAFGAYCLLQPFARDALGTDENGNSRYDAIPASELSRYLPISLGGGDYFKFPVGFGLPQIASLMAVGFDRVNQGTMKPQDLAFDVAFAAVHNMSPGGWPSFGFSENPAAYITNMVVPQFAKPFAEVAMNTNSFGSSIYNPTTGPEQAKSDAGKLTTPHRYHDMARLANEVFGIDSYPEAIRHFEQNYLRGPARFFTLWANETDDVYKGADKPTALNSVPPAIAALGITSLYGRVSDATRNSFYTAKKAYDERLRGENISFSGKPGNVDSADYRQAILEEAGWEPEAIEDYITLYKASVELRKQGRAFNDEYKEKWRGMTDPDELKEGFNRLADDNDGVYAGAVQKLHYWGS